MIKKDIVVKALKQVLDPELGISLVDMGLIYDVQVNKKGYVKVVMTLTTIGCPLYEMIGNDIKTELQKLPGIKKVEVELTFDPPWTIEKMSKNTRTKLGFE